MECVVSLPMTLASAFQSHQLADVRGKCYRDRLQQFHLHQERGRDHRGHRHDGRHWHRLLRPGGGQLPVAGRLGGCLLLLEPPRDPFKKTTSLQCKDWEEDLGDVGREGPSDRPQGASMSEWGTWTELCPHCLLQCVSSISAVCEVWRRMDKGIAGHRRRASCFQGPGEAPTHAIRAAPQLQPCTYVNNSNRGCV